MSDVIQRMVQLEQKGLSHRKIAELLLGSRSKKSTVSDALKKFRKLYSGEDGPNVQILDIETSPFQAYAWRRFKENIGQAQVLSQTQVLCWASKRLGSELVQFKGPGNVKKWNTDKEEKETLLQARDVLDAADVIIAHNGRKFDVPVLRTRMLKHGISPPSPCQVIDTLEIARSVFKFPSNKLGDIAEYLDLQGKEATGGFDLWVRCMEGDQQAWDTMETYNIRDIHVLEEVYKKLAPWSNKGFNFALHYNDGPRCPACGSSNVVQDGVISTAVSQFPAYHCMDCGKWSRGRTNILSKEFKDTLITH